MSLCFDEKYADVIEEMEKYLLDNHLSSIKLSFTNGWKFNLSILKNKIPKLIKKENEF